MTNKRIKTGVRQRDVATAAGVSSATVSAVVNGRAEQYGICQATREKVQSIIRQMGYSPSLAALDMAAGRNSLVGLAVSVDFPAADRLIAALEPALSQSAFRLVLAYLPPDLSLASARIASLLQFGVAGLVVCPSESLSLPKITCPAVIVGRPGVGLPAVYEDVAEGGRRLARHLLEKGHRGIAVFGAPGSTRSATAGFLDACAQGGATTRSFTSVAECLPVVGTLTAVFCDSSAMLLELYSRAASAGLRLGSSLAVVAVDPLGVAAYLVPRPTVLKPGGPQLGQTAARLLQQAIQGTTPGDVRLDPVLVYGNIIPSVSSSQASLGTSLPLPVPLEGGAPARGEPVEPSPPAPEPVAPPSPNNQQPTTNDQPCSARGEPVEPSPPAPEPAKSVVPPSEALQMPDQADISSGGRGLPSREPEQTTPVAEPIVTPDPTSENHQP